MGFKFAIACGLTLSLNLSANPQLDPQIPLHSPSKEELLLAEYQSHIKNQKARLEQKIRVESERLKKLQNEVERISKTPEELSFPAQVISLWREIVDWGLNRNIHSDLKFLVDGVPKALENEEKQKITVLSDDLARYQQSIQITKSKLINQQYQLLKKVGRMRAKVIEEAGNSWDPQDGEFFGDILREIRIAPYTTVNFFRARRSEFQAHLAKGWGGFIPLAQSMFVLLLNLLILPLLMLLVFRFSKSYFKKRRMLLAASASKLQKKKRLAFFLQRVEHFAPWILCYLLILLIEDYSVGSLAGEVRFVLPYLRFFIVYRVFVLFLKGEFRRIVAFSESQTLAEEKQKIERSAKAIGLYFLIAYSLMYATETVVSRAYVYQIVSELMGWGGFFLMVVVAMFWRSELVEGLHRSFQPGTAMPLARLLNKRAGALLAFPVLLLLAAKLSVVSVLKLLSHFEFAKKSLARLSRRQMEAAGAKLQDTDIESLPDEYLKYFSLGVLHDESLWIQPSNGDLKFCCHLVDKWIRDESEEHSLAIYGEKGSGKSSLLLGVARECSAAVITQSVPPKLILRQQVLQFLADCLGVSKFENMEQFTQWDQSASKTILMLDNCHNFILADIGGFEGFEAFIDFLNLRLENLFICTTFNVHSWRFLDSVCGRNRHFRSVLSISSWGEEDIHRLISIRHEKSEFPLSYDPIVFARSAKSYSDEFTTAEKKFFSILWEMSEGNPRAAIYYWLSSLRPVRGKLKVGLPVDREGEIFRDLQADTLFVYASVVKHENLSSSEAVRSTDLPTGLVRYALNVGLEREFLDRDKDGRYRVNPAWHNVVVNYLKQRNYLYDE